MGDLNIDLTDFYISNAKDKDKKYSKILLEMAIEHLQKKEPLREHLNEYIIECFQKVLTGENANNALNLVGYRKNKHYSRNLIIAEEFCLELDKLRDKNNTTSDKGLLRRIADNLLEQYQKDPEYYVDYPTSEEQIINIYKKYMHDARSKIECDNEIWEEHYS